MFDLRKRNRLPIVVPVVMKYCTSLGWYFSLLGEIEDSLPFDGQIATEFLPSCEMPLWFGTLLIITLGASLHYRRGVCAPAFIYASSFVYWVIWLVTLGIFEFLTWCFPGFRACLTVWMCALTLALLSRSRSRHCSLTRNLPFFTYIHSSFWVNAEVTSLLYHWSPTQQWCHELTSLLH